MYLCLSRNNPHPPPFFFILFLSFLSSYTYSQNHPATTITRSNSQALNQHPHKQYLDDNQMKQRKKENNTKFALSQHVHKQYLMINKNKNKNKKTKKPKKNKENRPKLSDSSACSQPVLSPVVATDCPDQQTGIEHQSRIIYMRTVHGSLLSRHVCI